MSRTKQPGGRGRGRMRRAVPVVTLGAVLAGGAAIAVPRLSPDDDAPAVAAVLEVAAATAADLSGTESVTGVVENAATIDVLHRIDGVTSSAAPATSEATPAAATPAVPAAFAGPDAAESAASAIAPVPAIAPTDPTSTTSTTSTTTSTTSPEPPPATDPVPTTTSAAATSEPTVSTLPSLPAPTTTTTVAGALPTTASTDEAGRPTGGGGAGGGAGGIGGALGSTGTATASGETATSVTERVTSLPALGQTIDDGDVLYSVDGSPVVAFAGQLPAWRTMSIDSEDGADITQLEESLVALGYGDDLTVDTSFDAATAAAVAAWQEGIGVEPTGDVPIGSIVFVPTDVTVTAVDAAIGDDVTSGDLIVSVAAATQTVDVDVAADQIGEFAVGQSVTVETGNGGDPIAGFVASRQSVTSEDGTTAVQATITPSAPLGVTDGVSVDVVVAVDSAIDTSAAVLIPAEALVSRLDGTYAVEVRDADGSSTWMPVDVVQFNGSTVAISGTGIALGTEVLVPA